MSDIVSYLTPGSANTFLALTAVSTAPAAGKKHVVGSWIIANNSSVVTSVDACIRRSAVDTYQVKNFQLSPGDSLFLHGLLGKVVLIASDVCYCKSSVSGAIDVTFSVAEEP